MASLTIRSLDETIKTKLRLRAAQHGWSMEQEVREILRVTLSSSGFSPSQNLAPGTKPRLRQPPSQLAGKVTIAGDLLEPVLPADEWNSLK
jgi:plasmid stability protein